MSATGDAHESSFSGHAGRVLRTAPLPLLGIALFGALGPVVELLETPSYRSVHSEVYFELPAVLDALLLGLGCLALWRASSRAAQQASPELLPVHHRRILRGAPTGLFIAFGIAQTFGLLQVIDRTPRGFPWQLFLAVTILTLSVGAALTRRGLRLTSWRCFTSQLAGHAVLMFPGLAWPFSQAVGRDLDRAYPGLCAGSCWLGLVGLLWAGRRGARWLDAASVALCAAVLLAVAPIYLSVRITRSYMVGKQERCNVGLELGPLWRAGADRDSVCEPGSLAVVSWGETALVGALGAGAIGWSLRRRGRGWSDDLKG